MAQRRDTSEKVANAVLSERNSNSNSNTLELSNDLYNIVLDKLNNSNIINNISIPTDITVSKFEKKFYYQSVCILPGDAIQIMKLSQKSGQWLNERRKRITASNCYELFTYFKNHSTTEDWSKKAKSYFKIVSSNIKKFLLETQTSQ